MKNLPVILVLVLVSAGTVVAQKDCSRPPLGRTPLSDMTNLTWNSIRGGLYPNGQNVAPLELRESYQTLAQLVAERSATGVPDQNAGKIVMIGVGASNPRTEFNAFVTEAMKDPTIRSSLVFANTCMGGQGIQKMNQVTDNYWKNAEHVLDSLGCSPQQVQIAWIETDNTQDADTTFPRAAETLADQLYELCSTMKGLYINLKFIYFSSRSYAGYIDPAAATAGRGLLSPRDYLNGWAIKFLIERQLTNRAGYSFTGDTPSLPALLWCTDNWADGLTPKSDGLFWHCDDYSGDGLHLSPLGEVKSGTRIYEFFSNDELAHGWFSRQDPTSVNEDNSTVTEQTIGIYSDFLPIESPLPVTVSIVDMRGATVWYGTIEGAVQIPLSNFSSGMYATHIGERTLMFIRQ
ncbi:MAG: T9SS type A sorting domain-containing protein [Candidatus Kapabacteria bacterium]|nr:T9SS type A sorting domain-containing protein [Candidatus Kapabacteria bacterium]